MPDGDLSTKDMRRLLDAAEQRLQDCEDDLGDAERDAPKLTPEYLDYRVRAVARAVAASSPQATAVLARYIALCREIALISPVVRFLGLRPDRGPLDEDHALLMRWRAALKSLEEDPDAQLPAGE